MLKTRIFHFSNLSNCLISDGLESRAEKWTVTFFSGEEGVDVAMTYLTIIETAKLFGLMVKDYLIHIFRQVMNGNKDYSTLVPGAVNL